MIQITNQLNKKFYNGKENKLISNNQLFKKIQITNQMNKNYKNGKKNIQKKKTI